MLAQAANLPVQSDQLGSWILVAFLVLQGISILVGLLGYFATKSEVKKMDDRITLLEKAEREHPDRINAVETRLQRSDEARVSAIHSRLNPLEGDTRELKGTMNAFANSFEKFTRIIEATSRQRDDQINAFTRALETFASVLEERKR